MRDLEKEIAVIENLIRLLKSCRTIAKNNNRIEEVISCNKDIETCQAELKKLLERRAQHV
jgi:hypothetical protein